MWKTRSSKTKWKTVLKIKKQILLVIFVWAFWTGCTSRLLLNNSSAGSYYFTARAQITIAAEENVLNFSADIQFSPRDSFHIEVKGPFGFSLGEVYIINSRFLYLNRMDRHMLSGESNDNLLEAVLHIPVEPDLLAKVTLLPHIMGESSDTIISGYNISVLKRNRKKNITLLQLHRDGSPINIRYDRFKKIGGVLLPEKIWIKDDDKGQYMQIGYKDIKKVAGKFPDLPVVDENYKQLSW